MKTTLRSRSLFYVSMLAASFAVGAELFCSAQVTNGVGIAGPFNYSDTNGSVTYFIVDGVQLANHEFHLQQAGEPTFANPIDGAVWSCYPLEQPIATTFNANIFDRSYFRSLNLPCGQFRPAGATPPAIIEPNPILTREMRLYRVTRNGKLMRIGAEILPTVPGQRRFLLVEATGTTFKPPPPPPLPAADPMAVAMHRAATFESIKSEAHCPKCQSTDVRLVSKSQLANVRDGDKKVTVLRYDLKCGACGERFRKNIVK